MCPEFASIAEDSLVALNWFGMVGERVKHRSHGGLVSMSPEISKIQDIAALGADAPRIAKDSCEQLR